MKDKGTERNCDQVTFSTFLAREAKSVMLTIRVTALEMLEMIPFIIFGI